MRIKIRKLGELENFQDRLHKIKEVKLQTRPSINDIKQLQEKLPNLERVVVAPSIYRLLARSLTNEGITIAIEASADKRGRPRKHDDEKVKRIIDMWKANKRVQEISRALNMPERTVYYYIKMHKNRLKELQTNKGQRV